ncbi:MAG TPA: type II toxin-antitoxin system Phd/YefM family antitoxin [Acidimicrobiales bacterium]|nr:type II toxin-antitoxin system Phd/YefM family antitoxin [Acidimicrobiales bacterium]
MNTLPITEARSLLSKLVDEASSAHEYIEIAEHGRRAAVLMGVDYDAMREAVAVRSDPALPFAHQEGVQAHSEGVLNGDQLAEAVDDAGRSVDST